MPKESAVRVLGVDPGLQCTGYGIVEAVRAHTLSVVEAGIIRTRSADSLPKRLRKIYTGIAELLDAYTPDAVALEELFSFYQNPKTAIMMAHARGVVCLAAAERDIAVTGYAARRVKKAICGAGAAPKQQMQRMIKDILHLKQEPQPHDVADALALAVTHIHALRRER